MALAKTRAFPAFYPFLVVLLETQTSLVEIRTFRIFAPPDLPRQDPLDQSLGANGTSRLSIRILCWLGFLWGVCPH
jgi:hypothetical protein